MRASWRQWLLTYIIESHARTLNAYTVLQFNRYKTETRIWHTLSAFGTWDYGSTGTTGVAFIESKESNEFSLPSTVDVGSSTEESLSLADRSWEDRSRLSDG
jgi:hypothetical protein